MGKDSFSNSVTYRMVYFTEAKRWIGMAWNYKIAVLIATKPFETREVARMELQHTCHDRELVMRWYDGEYQCSDGETLLSVDGSTSKPIG